MGESDVWCACFAILCSYGIGRCLASLFPPHKRAFAEKAIRMYAYQVYSMVMLGVCFFIVGIVALILGIVFIRLPGSGATYDTKIVNYNNNVKDWSDMYRADLVKLNPTVYLKGMPFSMNSVTTVDTMSGIDAESKKQLANYTPLKYSSGEVELVPAGVKFDPNLRYNFLIASRTFPGAPRNLTTLSIPVYLKRTSASSSDFFCSSDKGYFNQTAKTCTVFFKMSSICVLVDSGLSTYAALTKGVGSGYGCGLTNERGNYVEGEIRYKEAVYTQLPITGGNPNPDEDNNAVIGSITVRDSNDPYVQLYYATGGYFSFNTLRTSSSPLLAVGIVMFCLFGFSAFVIFGLCLGGCTSTRQKIIAFIILEESRSHTASTAPPTGGSFVVQTTVTHHHPETMPGQYPMQPGMMQQPMQPYQPGMQQPYQPGMQPMQPYQPGMMQPGMQQPYQPGMQPYQPGMMQPPMQHGAPYGQQYGQYPGAPVQPGFNPEMMQQPGQYPQQPPQNYGQYPTAPHQ